MCTVVVKRRQPCLRRCLIGLVMVTADGLEMHKRWRRTKNLWAGSIAVNAVGIAVEIGLRRRLRWRATKGDDLRTAWLAILFPFGPSIPIQADTVIAGLALSLAIGTAGFLFSATCRSARAK